MFILSRLINKMKILILTIAVLLCIPPLTAEAQTGPAEVVSAAAAGLHSFLDRIPMENRQDYGFTKTDSLDKAYLGDPFNLQYDNSGRFA